MRQNEFCEKHCGSKSRIHQQSVTFEPVYNMCKDDFKHEEKQENIIENVENQHNITSKLLRIFKSKKWRQKTTTCNNEIIFDKPLSFPKVKLRKTSQAKDVIDTRNNQVNHHPAAIAKHQEFIRTPLKISKSLPLRKPVIVWEEIQEFQRFIPSNCDEKISVGTQTELSCLKQVSGQEHRKIQRVSITQITQNQNKMITQPKLSVMNKQRVSLDRTKSSDDDECNMEVYKTFCHVPGNSDGAADSSHQSTSSSRSRELDGISSVISEMISPTMMMETEVDTDTDTIEENDDKNNIYEEVLNNETFRLRHNHSKLSTTSSIYRNSWWDSHHNNVHYQQKFHVPVAVQESIPKQKLCRTSKSINGLSTKNSSMNNTHNRPQQQPATVMKGGVSKTLSEKFSYLGMKNYNVFRTGK